ncbi:hypothetical protein ACKKBF_B39985 [Auxenochlorella protothecoides x Auxenochlorella symbiontica]
MQITSKLRLTLRSAALPRSVEDLLDVARRGLSSAPSLKEALAEKIPAEQERVKALKKEHGSKILGQVTVEQAIGGMRGIPCMLWETSLLDADEGIRFRGYTIPELQEKLPGAAPAASPCPRACSGCCSPARCPPRPRCPQ